MDGLKKITPELSRKLVELLRDYNVLHAESELFLRILKQADKEGFLPAGWLVGQISAGRLTQTYLNVAQANSEMLATAENITDVVQITDLIANNPSAKIEN